jgi:hypothetical protein
MIIGVTHDPDGRVVQRLAVSHGPSAAEAVRSFRMDGASRDFRDGYSLSANSLSRNPLAPEYLACTLGWP